VHDSDLWARRHETTNCNPPERRCGPRGALSVSDSSNAEWLPYGTALGTAPEEQEEDGGLRGPGPEIFLRWGVPRVLARRSHLLPEQRYGSADDQPRVPAESVASPTAGCNPILLAADPLECAHDDTQTGMSPRWQRRHKHASLDGPPALGALLARRSVCCRLGVPCVAVGSGVPIIAVGRGVACGSPRAF
jgi:hypothetical protein